LDDAMWGKKGEKTGNSGREEAMLQVWERKTQEVGVSKEEREKERRGGTSAKDIGEDKVALWNKEAVSKRSSHEHGWIDNMVGGCNPSRI